MLLFILTLFILGCFFYYFMIKPINYWKNRGMRRGNPKWIITDYWKTLTRKESLAEIVQRVYNRCHGVRYFGMYLFVPSLILKDPDLIKQITVKDFEHFLDHRTLIPEDADPLWGKNLFALKGQRWRDMRAILSPSFTSSKIKSMFLLISECSENFIQHFMKKDEDVITVEFKDLFTRFTNDVIATTAFGIQVDSLSLPNNNFYLMVKEATDFSGLWKNFKLYGHSLCPKMFAEIVSDSIRAREENSIVRQDMINLLLEARKDIQKNEKNDTIDTGFSTAQETNFGKPKTPKEITVMDITAQAMLFFFAGFDTLSSFICFMAYELTVNPDIQDRLRDEIKYALDECRSKLTYESLLKMKYFDMVVSETLRKWPISVTADRICTEPYTIEPVTPDEKPVHLQKGDVLWLPIFGIHRDPIHYPDPERFDPERFSDENKSNIKPYTYFPFGLGPRNCIGSRFALLTAKTVIFHILNNFELVPVEKSRIPLEISKKEFCLNADDGFWFGLKRITM